MKRALKAVLKHLVKRPDRRRYRRLPCHITAHFFVSYGDRRHRGSAIITDISRDGLCLNNSSLFHTDIEFRLKPNNKLLIYFSLPRRKGGTHNFEVKGKIRSIMQKDQFGHVLRFGIKFTSIKRQDKKVLRDYIAFLEKQTHTKK